MRKKVVVGMSGGVDSSVAAYLLKQQGYDVIGITMNVWQGLSESESECDIQNGCCGVFAVSDARRVCEMLDIPHYVLNFKDIFKQKVVEYFANEYLKGLTPNPCIACNRYIKWETLLSKAMQLGADYIATGHYATVAFNEQTGRFFLKKSVAANKDQTYALYSLTQEQLKHTLMPVGAYTKEEVRNIAKDIGLKVANKPDSQEICFVPNGEYGDFIKKYKNINVSEGNFIDINDNVLGKHKGIIYYTVGQRKKLGEWFGKRMYVKKINILDNTVTLSDNDALFENELFANDINLMYVDKINNPIAAKVKIRYNQKATDCIISIKNNIAHCKFTQPQRAITPGQAVVFYDLNDIICIGGGTIISS